MSRAGQTFTYDAEGYPQSVTNTTTNSSSTYLYANGSLLVQRDPASSQVILYLPWGEEIHLNTSGTGTVSGLRYHTSSPDGIVLVRSSAGTLTYELTDSRDTAATTVDAGSLGVTRRYLDPYGNARGPAPTAWPDQHGYLNEPSDPSTGLSLLGTRQYDPVSGRFLSVDPIMDATDPQQTNGYVYAGDNPVSHADPSGAMLVDPGGGGGGCVCPPPHRTPAPPPPTYNYYYYPVYTPPTYYWFLNFFAPPVVRPTPPAPPKPPAPRPPPFCDFGISLFCSGLLNTNRNSDSGGSQGILSKLPRLGGCAITWIGVCLGGGATVGIGLNLSKTGKKGGTGVGRPNGGPRRGGGNEPPWGGRIPPRAPGYVRGPSPKEVPTDPAEWETVKGLLRKLAYIIALAAYAYFTICETDEAFCQHHSPPPPPPHTWCHAQTCIGPAP
jgi:RHS repeat-associated protein